MQYKQRKLCNDKQQCVRKKMLPDKIVIKMCTQTLPNLNPLVLYVSMFQMGYFALLNTARCWNSYILVNTVLVWRYLVTRNSLSNFEKSIYINSLYTIQEGIYKRMLIISTRESKLLKNWVQILMTIFRWSVFFWTRCIII